MCIYRPIARDVLEHTDDQLTRGAKTASCKNGVAHVKLPSGTVEPEERKPANEFGLFLAGLHSTQPVLHATMGTLTWVADALGRAQT